MTRYHWILLTVPLTLTVTGCHRHMLLERAEVVDHKNRDLSGISRVHIEAKNGTVDVHGDEGETDIDVHATKFARGRTAEEAQRNAESISVAVSRTSPTSPVLLVIVDVPDELRQRSPGANLDISIPPRVDLEIHTSNGPVEVKKAGGQVDVHTRNGNVKILQVSGDVVAKTSNGSILLEDINGNTDLQSSNGRITLERVEAERNVASTSNGSIRAKEVSGSTSFETNNGSIELISTSLPENPELKAETNNGSIYIEVPATANAHLHLRTGGGRIFERLGSAKVTDYQHSKRKIDATLNGGGGNIEARTDNGVITFRTN